MATFSLTNVVSTPNQTISKTNVQTGSSALSIVETAAPAATTEIQMTLDVSATKAFIISSDVAATLKTNSSGSPANTIVLVANQPYIWFTGDYNAFLLTTDVTKIFVVVAGAGAAEIRIEAVVDATP